MSLGNVLSHRFAKYMFPGTVVLERFTLGSSSVVVSCHRTNEVKFSGL